MKNPLTLAFLSPLAPFGWPIVRVVAGALLVIHGWQKWDGGVGKWADVLAGMGAPVPQVSAWLSIFAELVCGALLAIGLLTRFAGLVIAVNMAAALYLNHAAEVAKLGTAAGTKAEYPLLLAAVGVCALFAGAGRLSVDAMLARKHAP